MGLTAARCCGGSGAFRTLQFLNSMTRPLDAGPVPDATLDNLDPMAIARFRDELRHLHPGDERLGLSDEMLLLRSGATVERRGLATPTLAGLLFFGRAPQQFFPAFTITFLHFAGTSIEPPRPDAPLYLDNREVSGRIPEMIDAARGLLHRAMSKIGMVEGFRRLERPEYPDIAIREALLNAIAHRDYSRVGSFIQVRLFADRLEVQSPGGLAGGLTIENILWEQYTRNPTLTRLLEDLGYVERRGVGVDLMVQAMRAAGLPDPIFADHGTSFWVTLQSAAGPEPVDERFKDLNERQERALAHLREHGRITNREYVTLFEVAERTALYDLQDLVERRLLIPVGSGRGRYYILRE